MPGPDYHGWTHGPNGVDPAPASGTPQFNIKVAADDISNSVGDGKFQFMIPDDMDGMNLTKAEAFVTTVAGGGTVVTVQIRNRTQGADMLSTRITIDAGEFSSRTAATPPVVDTANDDVAAGDLIAIDVDVAGSGAKGLGVILDFA